MDISAEILAAVQPEQEDEPQEPVEETPQEPTVEEEPAPTAEEPQEEEPPKERLVPLKAVEDERRKRQELEKRLTDLENTAQQREPKTIEEWYDVNPKGTMDYLNNEINRLASEDPYSNAAQIEFLRDKKIELRERAHNSVNTKRQEFASELGRVVKGYDGRKDDLTDFAVNELGYSREDFTRLTDPLVVGKNAAINTLKLVNQQYETAQAPQTLKKKEVKPQPTKVETPGEGIPKQELSQAELKKRMQSGDEAAQIAYLQSLGVPL